MELTEKEQRVLKGCLSKKKWPAGFLANPFSSFSVYLAVAVFLYFVLHNEHVFYIFSALCVIRMLQELNLAKHLIIKLDSRIQELEQKK